MSKYNTVAGSELTRRKVEAILEDTSLRIGASGDAEAIIANLKTSIKTFYDNLSNPLSTPLILEPKGNRSLAEYEAYLLSVKRDLEILHYSSVQAVDALAKGFNYASALTEAVFAKSQRLASMSEDLSLISDTPTQSVFVAGDRFVDSTKIDLSFGNAGTRADLTPSGGSMTLKRTALSRVVSPSTTKIDVQVGDGFEYNPSAATENRTQDDPNKDFRVYEGRYYAYANTMEPAGGITRWTKIQVGADNRELEPVALSSNSGESGPEAEARRNEVNRLIEARTVIVPDTPTTSELNQVRSRMVDDNPTTYWQIESTFNPFHSTDEERFREAIAGLSQSQSAEALRGLVKSVDTHDFDVTILLDLGQTRVVNFINLVPENFGEEAWLEVIALETSTTKEGPWRTIDGLFENRYENTLSPEANQELTNEEVAATLSPSRYAYAGQGVFSFSPVEAKFVRVTIRQKIPVPSPYHVVRYKLVRHATTTLTKTRKVGLFE